jgi:succinate dehydrogenase/fumarate reductase flavoprotein subunit
MAPTQRKKTIADETLRTDILVLGGGIAGCFAAIRARESGLDVVLVDKGHLGRSGTSYQMSGVMTCFDPERDNHDLWYRECVETSEWMADQDCLSGMIPETFERVREMESWGVEFQKHKGRWIRKPGVGHVNARNILMVEGGFQLQSVLRGEVLRRGVLVVERVMATELLRSNKEAGRVTGAVGFNIRTGRFYVFESRATILATGSARAIWTGMRLPMLSGDGNAMAFRAGCDMRNRELAVYYEVPADFDSIGPGSNVLFGEGAVLVNAGGERFMERWDPRRMERAARSIRFMAVATEQDQGRGPIYLDATGLDDAAYARIEKALPIPIRCFKAAGLDLRKDQIRWSYTLADHSPGGVRADRDGATTLPGLFVAGDTSDHSSSGACNIITHGMVSAIEGDRSGRAALASARAAEREAHDPSRVNQLISDMLIPLHRETGLSHHQIREGCMAIWPLLGPRKNEARLKSAIVTAREIRNEEIPKLAATDFHELSRCIGLANELHLIELYARCALLRTESRGAHFREEYPEKDDANWLRWVIARKNGEAMDAMELWTEPIPFERYPLRPPSVIAAGH